MKNIYLLKDVCQMSGHSVHTLKYYLRLGLVEEIGRSPSTNFRYFDDSTLERLKMIRALRGEGLSLEEISRRLSEKP